MAMRKTINLQAYCAKDMSLAEMASALMRKTLMTAAEVKDYHNSVKARIDCPVGVSPEAWELFVREQAPSTTASAPIPALCLKTRAYKSWPAIHRDGACAS